MAHLCYAQSLLMLKLKHVVILLYIFVGVNVELTIKDIYPTVHFVCHSLVCIHELFERLVSRLALGSKDQR